MKKYFTATIILLILFFSGCSEEVVDIAEFEAENSKETGAISDTVYIQVNPVWDYQGFNNPQDIIVGREQFIYVADTDNDRIVMMNLDGKILGTRNVKHPVAIAQDYKLNLIVCAQFDTTIDNQLKTFSAVYKVKMYNAGHNIGSAEMIRILPRTSTDLVKANRTYTGVCVFSNNSFFIARSGPSNGLIDPDNSILMFWNRHWDDKDTLVGRVPLLEPEGSGLLSVYNVSSLTAFNKKNSDIIITLTGNNSFRTQWLQYVSSNEFTGYVNKLSPFSTDLMVVDRFKRPEGSALDAAGNIYIADAEKDSVFKFNSSGDELQSFGGSGLFKQPYAVAHYNKTLYVADKGNNRILRFILSTELD